MNKETWNNHPQLEVLAAVQHEIWSHWMKYFISVCHENQDGTYTIPLDQLLHWQCQMQTDYEDLTEIEKESDREQAKKVISIINKNE